MSNENQTAETITPTTHALNEGECLCGRVKLTVSELPKSFSACHCQQCRQWGGGPLLTFDLKSGLNLKGEENIKVFNSSDWAERGFCGHCGSHLFYRLKQNQQYFVPTGLFKAVTDLAFDHQVFIDQKPDYYAFANETVCLTGQELFDAYASETNDS